MLICLNVLGWCVVCVVNRCLNLVLKVLIVVVGISLVLWCVFCVFCVGGRISWLVK